MSPRKNASKSRSTQADSPDLQVYTASFQPEERQDLEALLSTGVRDEIAMLRVVIRRAFTLASAAGEDPQERSEALQQALQVVKALGAATQRLSVLLKTQQSLGEGGDDVAAAITQALNEVVEEMGWK